MKQERAALYTALGDLTREADHLVGLMWDGQPYVVEHRRVGDTVAEAKKVLRRLKEPLGEPGE